MGGAGEEPIYFHRTGLGGRHCSGRLLACELTIICGISSFNVLSQPTGTLPEGAGPQPRLVIPNLLDVVRLGSLIYQEGYIALWNRPNRSAQFPWSTVFVGKQARTRVTHQTPMASQSFPQPRACVRVPSPLLALTYTHFILLQQMMSSPATPAVFTFFAGRGHIETPRFLLAFVGVPFINNDFKSPDDYWGLKESGKLAFGQVRACVQQIQSILPVSSPTVLPPRPSPTSQRFPFPSPSHFTPAP